MTEEKKPGFVDRQRAAYPWFDHLVRAAKSYQEKNGDFFAAGTTYFTVFAMFPVIMVAFAAAGFVLVHNPEMLADVRDKVAESSSGDTGKQLNDLIDNAIASRTAVGVIGLIGALYAGLGWMANLRQALTAQWDQQSPKGNFLKTKASDLGALLGLFAALIVSVALTAIGDGSVISSLLEKVGLEDVPGIGVLLQIVSLLISFVASWVLFTWVIAKLPREAVTVRSAIKAGLMTAVVFEVFKKIAAIYLKSVTSGPAGATFGPVLGIMVFFFITWRIVLFATAWAATAQENLDKAPVRVPDPALITTRVVVSGAPSAKEGLALAGMGALAVLGISGVVRRKKNSSD
ncbi:MAG: inner membrane protein YhjD [Mycobacteriaceae bacterium]